MSNVNAPAWRHVLYALPDGVVDPLPPKPHDVPGLTHVEFVGAHLIVNTLRKKTSQGGRGWLATIVDREFVYQSQVVLEGDRRIEPGAEEAETAEEFRLRAIIMALASGFRLPAAE